MNEAWRVERAYPVDGTRTRWTWQNVGGCIREAKTAWAIARALADEGKPVRVCELPEGEPEHRAVVRETFNADRMRPEATAGH